MGEASARHAQGSGSPAANRGWWPVRRGRSASAPVVDDSSLSDAAPSDPDPAGASAQPTAPAPSASARDELLKQLRMPAPALRPADGVAGPANTEQKLTRLLADVREAIPSLTGSMIASDEGLPICHDFPDSDAEMVAAMAALALDLATRISDRTAMGQLLETVVRSVDGCFVVYAAGPSAVLVLAGPSSVNLGAMRIEARALSAHVSEILR